MAPAGQCRATVLADVICLNRYYGWYKNKRSDLDAAKALDEELEKWHELHPEKPIMLLNMEQIQFLASTI